MFKYIESKLKLFIALICIALLASCQGDSKNSNLELSNFINPEYLFHESLLSCKLVESKTLNSVERFIPKFVDSFITMGGGTEELYFLFPLVNDQTDTQVFEVLLNHSDSLALDRLNLTLAALSFDDIAKCANSSVSGRTLLITDQTIFASPVIAEILECNYRDGYSLSLIHISEPTRPY